MCIGTHPGTWELRQLLHERIFVHPELRLPPPKSIMDRAKARHDPRDADSTMLGAYADAGLLPEPGNAAELPDAVQPAESAQVASARVADDPGTWQINDGVEVQFERTVEQEGVLTPVWRWEPGFRFH